VEETQTTVADHWDFHPLGESIVRVFCFERLTIQAFEKKLSDRNFGFLLHITPRVVGYSI
jgi:hypothetical protein